MGCVSFHHTKNAVCGKRRGLMITKNRGHWQYARQYRLHGTNRAGYLDGEAARYTWNLPGSCTALSEPQAALLLAQLQCLSQITRSRLHVTEQYWKQLAPLEERGIAMRMRIPAYARPNGHIFYLRFQDPALLNSLSPPWRPMESTAKRTTSLSTPPPWGKNWDTTKKIYPNRWPVIRRFSAFRSTRP